MVIVDFIERGVNRYFAFIPRKRPSKTCVRQAKLIAHRGAHDRNRHIIENTLEAFDHAQRLGCWGIECDVRATVDDVLMVHHDPDLSRLWRHTNKISELTYEQLRKKVPQIPSLEEVIERYGQKMHLFIELKTPFAQEEKLQQLLKSLTPSVDYHLITLDADVFNHLSHFPKESLLLVPEYNNVAAFCKLSLTKPYGGVLGHYLLFCNHKINRLKQAGQQIGVGFVDSKNSLYRELNRGIEWIFTNRAEEVACYIQQLRA